MPIGLGLVEESGHSQLGELQHRELRSKSLLSYVLVLSDYNVSNVITLVRGYLYGNKNKLLKWMHISLWLHVDC